MNTQQKKPPRTLAHRLHISQSKMGSKNPMYQAFADKNPAYKGGITKHKYGYIFRLLTPDSPYFPMVNRQHYVLEHRLVLARHLGRILHDDEFVFHKNRNPADNRIENLTLERTKIKRGYEIENKDKAHGYSLISCPQCGEQRWLLTRALRTIMGLCRSCRQKGANNIKWRGGECLDKSGYILTWLPATSPFYPMTNKAGRVRKHRLTMAQHLGRCLFPYEIIHHINGDKTNNDIANLTIIPTPSEHNGITFLQSNIHKLKSYTRTLETQLQEKQNNLPKWSKK